MGDVNSVPAYVLGTIGTVCWCVQLIPQIYFNHKRKNCEGFPPMMMLLWATCGIPFAIYFISTRANIIIQIQPILFVCFCLVAWTQALYYPPVQLPKTRIMTYVICFILVAVGCEVGFTLWLRKLYDKGKEWPSMIFGILASVLLALGLVPAYLELGKRQGRVVGINFLFLAVDLSGAFFSMLSVALGKMDIMGLVLYTICMAMEIGIFVSHFIWCLRFKWFGKRDEKDEEDSIIMGEEENDTYDDVNRVESYNKREDSIKANERPEVGV